MIDYDHPNLTVTSSAPGHYAILNLPLCYTDTPEGKVVAPTACYISPAVPTDFLKAIVAEREAKGSPRNAAATDTRMPAARPLLERIKVVVTEKAQPLAKLAEMFDVEPEDIESLHGLGLWVGHTGRKWVKLATTGGAV